MFDIGFAELLIIAVVGLLVIGPERLPGAIRTGSAWLGRLRRGFNDIKREVEQELHNDAVMRELKEAGQQLKDESEEFGREVKAAQRKAQQDVEQVRQSVEQANPAVQRDAATDSEQGESSRESGRNV